MKRWLVHLFIGAYLSALGIGIICHTIGFGLGSHPAMYYIVWDMFCGWANFETHMQIIAEGESGAFYELAPAPWGDFNPYGSLGRRNYDTFAAHGPRIAMNTLKHTQHEPITRVFVVEQAFAKKFNLSDEDYLARFNEPKEPYVYSHLRVVTDGQGMVMQRHPDWLTYQYSQCVTDNPRLIADSRRSKPFYVFGNGTSNSITETPAGAVLAPRAVTSGSPLGN